MTDTAAALSLENFFDTVKRLISPSHYFVFRLDTNGVIVSIEGNGYHLIERTHEQLINKSFFEVYKNVPPITTAVQKALGGEAAEVSEWSHARFFNFQLLPIRDENTVTGVAGIAIDETSKILDPINSKENEQESDSWFYNCFLEIPEAMQLVLNGRVVFSNKAAQQLFHYSDPNIPVGVTIAELIQKWASQVEKYRKYLTLKEIEEIIKGAEQGKTCQFEQDGLLPDGSILAIRTTIYPLRFKGIPHLLFFSQDVTAFLEAQRQEAFVEDLFSSLQDGVLYIDSKMKIRRVNSNLIKMFPKADFTDIQNRPCYEILRGRTEPCDDCAIQKTMQDGQKHSRTEYWEDIDRWIETSSFPIYDRHSNEMTGIIQFIQDVTDQHYYMELLEERKKIFAAVMNSSNDGILARSDGPDGYRYNSRLLEMFDGDVSMLTMESSKISRKLLNEIAFNEDEIFEAQQRLRETSEQQEGTLYLRNGRIYEWRGVAVRTGVGDSGQTRIWKFHDITEVRRAAQIIQQQKEQYQLLFESMTNGIMIVDVIRDENGQPIDYIIVNVNQAYVENLKTARSDLIGQSLLKLLPQLQVLSHDYGEHWWTGLDEASFGKSGIFHVYIPGIENPYHEVVAFRTQKDQVGILQYSETDRVLAEQTLRTMQVAIEHLSEPVLWLDETGTLIYANDAVAASLNYDPNKLASYQERSKPSHPLGAKIWNFDTQHTEKSYSEWFNQLQKNQTIRFETIMLDFDDKKFPIMATCDFLEYNGKRMLVACYHDLSERMQRVEAEQASLVKSRFLAHMSHELRTPLNGIIGIIEILLNTKLSEKQRKNMELAQISGHHLLNIVNDILDFSQLEAGRLELKLSEFDLPELIENTTKTLTSQIQDRHLKFDCLFSTDIPRHVVGDSDRLRKVLMAFLNNGLKFTKEGNVKLAVSLESWKEQKGIANCVVRFTVTDTGIGIPQDRLHLLFHSFSQVDVSFTKEYGGIGMGLAIAHQLVRLMGGDIGVESQENIGSKFWFTVPFVSKKNDWHARNILQLNHSETIMQPTTQPVVAEHAKETNDSEEVQNEIDDQEPMELQQEKWTSEGGGGNTGKTEEHLILVVEDNRINQIVVSEILTQAGFRFEVAVNGAKAVEAFSDKHFSLILMDCQMPVMDGFEATQKIRNLESERAAARTPIIALTANTAPSDEEHCINVGMDAFCSKPINAEKLIEMIQNWISKSSNTLSC
ncbi:MAG: response regulator [Planctomycetaceae bacterium]|nr:response regulator [Planctomycetaceae bacterium]